MPHSETFESYPDFRTTKDIREYERQLHEKDESRSGSECIWVVNLAPRWTSSRCLFECGYVTWAQGQAIYDAETPDSDFLVELGGYGITSPPTACEKENREKQEISLLLRQPFTGKKLQETRVSWFPDAINQHLKNITTLEELNQRIDSPSPEYSAIQSLAPDTASYDENYIRHLLRCYKRGIISPAETSYTQDLEGNITKEYWPEYTIDTTGMFYVKIKLPWYSEFLKNNLPYSPIIFPEKKAIQDDPSHIANDPNWIKLVS